MKEVLDSNTKISKEAKECVQECVGEFIAFITSEASFQCKNQKRKTVNGEDILWALGQVGFDDYKIILQEYLNKYKAVNFFFFVVINFRPTKKARPRGKVRNWILVMMTKRWALRMPAGIWKWMMRMGRNKVTGNLWELI
jgi:histone H3/H4